MIFDCLKKLRSNQSFMNENIPKNYWTKNKFDIDDLNYQNQKKKETLPNGGDDDDGLHFFLIRSVIENQETHFMYVSLLHFPHLFQ